MQTYALFDADDKLWGIVSGFSAETAAAYLDVEMGRAPLGGYERLSGPPASGDYYTAIPVAGASAIVGYTINECFAGTLPESAVFLLPVITNLIN